MRVKDTYKVLTELTIVGLANVGCQSPALLPIESLCTGEEASDEVTLRARLDGQSDSFARSYMAANGVLFFCVKANREYWGQGRVMGHGAWHSG